MLNSYQYFNLKQHRPWGPFETPILYYPGGLDDIEPLDLILGGEALGASYDSADICDAKSRL